MLATWNNLGVNYARQPVERENTLHILVRDRIKTNINTHKVSNISNTSDSVSSGYPNTEKRVEKRTRSGVFLTEFEVFG